MPTEREKFYVVKFKYGWRVEDSSGKAYSKSPMTKKKATEQQKALYANISGKGFIGDATTKLKSVAGKVVERVQSVLKGVRNNYPPYTRQMLTKYGNWNVIGLKVRREPIKAMLNQVLDAITLGKWSKAKDELAYDKVFHLSLIVTLQSPTTNETNDILVEKNEVINMADNYDVNNNQEYFIVPVTRRFTLNTMMNSAQRLGGKDFFKYNAFTNNCQMFIDLLLNAVGLNSPQAKEFILQSTEELAKRLPEYTPAVAQVTTDIAGLANVALYGEGRNPTVTVVGSGAKKLNMFELFKGTGSVGKVASKNGFNVVSVDFDPIYTPTIETDILDWDYKSWAKQHNFKPDYIWASPPCNTFSPLVYKLRERDPKTAKPKSERARIGTKILHRTIEIIKYFQSLNPKMLYTIENPVGMMRRDSIMKKLPNRESTYYKLYGDKKIKPTDFWSNFDMDLKPMKGNKKVAFKDYVPVAGNPSMDFKYSIPPRLIKQIISSAKEFYGNTPMSGPFSVEQLKI